MSEEIRINCELHEFLREINNGNNLELAKEIRLDKSIIDDELYISQARTNNVTVDSIQLQDPEADEYSIETTANYYGDEAIEEEHEELKIGENQSWSPENELETDERAESSSRLTVTEAFGAACALSKWLDLIFIQKFTTGDKLGTCEPCTSGEPAATATDACVSATMQRTVWELRSTAAYGTLARLVERTLTERRLKVELSANRNKVAAWFDVVWESRKRQKQEKWNIENKLKELSAQYEKTKKFAEERNEYFLLYEKAWIMYNKELIIYEERNLKNQIQDIDKTIAINDDFATEIRHTFSKRIATLNDFIGIWEKKYTKDTGGIRLEILNLEQEQEDLDNSLEQIQAMKDHLQTLIGEFEARKHERDEYIKKRTHINNMAIKIQAFWRGTMVRKFLGRYKKLKKLFKKKPVKNSKKKLKKK